MKMGAWHRHGYPAAIKSKNKIHFMMRLTKAKINKSLRDCLAWVMIIKAMLMKKNSKF